MPHKKNPDVFELIRARCNRLMALPNELALIQSNMNTGYHRDWQLFKEHVFPAIDECKACFQMAATMLESIEVNENILEKEQYRYLFTVEAVNEKVLEGKAFRTAYQEVGSLVESGDFVWNKTLTHQHEGSLGNLCNEQIERQLKEVIRQIGVE